MLNSKSSPQLTSFVSYRYFPQLCLGRKHHQRNTHIQTPSGVAHHLPRVHHTCRSLSLAGVASWVLDTGAGGLWGSSVMLPPRGAPGRGLQTAPTWDGMGRVP